MQLININKNRYRRHLNWVIASCVIALTVGSLGIAQTLIALFPDPSGSHFHWNLSGVIVSSLFIGLVLNRYRQHAFMTEVTYVWELKQALNSINRNMLKIKPAAEAGNINALTALQFCYAGSRLLWQLDDNTILMDELTLDQAALDKLADQYSVTLNASDYSKEMLDNL